MDLLTHRYRDVTVLVLVIVAQVLLLGYQVRSNQDVRLVRVWAVTAVTPAARLLETVRSGAASLLSQYVLLMGVEAENEKLTRELGRLKQEVRYLRSELATAKHAEALQAFAKRTPSETVAARIIGAVTDAGSQAVLIDRGAGDGIAAGMAVVTPDGVVGRVTAAYPTASRVLLITDSQFAAGVISQTHHVQGTVHGQGTGLCRVDYVQNEEIVEEGEWFYTSGDDRAFPRGLPVGQAIAVEKGQVLKKIQLAPAGLAGGLNEVLVVLRGVHQPVPAPGVPASGVPLLPPAPAPEETGEPGAPAPLSPRMTTDADRLLETYKAIGSAQGHTFGEGLPGSRPPDFNFEHPSSQPGSVPEPVAEAASSSAPDSPAEDP